MNNHDCSQIEELLVDYADSALDQSDVDKVTAHLAQCPNCRNTLSALIESLKLASAIWQDNLRQPPAAKTHRRSLTWRKYAAIAASIAILAAAAIICESKSQPKQPEPTLAQIEQQIEQAASAARLLAAADMLAPYTQTESIARNQYDYIVDAYPRTPAAVQAKEHLKRQ
jgi:predicted anti-sigma-YlaC factor YlaD